MWVAQAKIWNTRLPTLGQRLLSPIPSARVEQREGHCWRGQLIPSDKWCGTLKAVEGSSAAAGLGSPLSPPSPEDQHGERSGLSAMACPCSQYRQGPGVAASRSQPPERATKHASTQLPGMSSTWKTPRHPYPASQEKYPAHQPIHEDFILSGLKGPGEGRGKFTRTALMWVPRGDHFLNERQRKGGKKGEVP